MTNTQIDHLLQSAVPRSDTVTSDRARDATPPFDHHFRQARTPSSPSPASSSSSPPASPPPKAARDGRPPTPAANSLTPPTAAPEPSAHVEAVEETAAVDELDEQVAADEQPTGEVEVTTAAVVQVVEPTAVETVVVEPTLDPAADPNRSPATSDAETTPAANNTVETNTRSDRPAVQANAKTSAVTESEAAVAIEPAAVGRPAKVAASDPEPQPIPAAELLVAGQVEPSSPTATDAIATGEPLEAAAAPANKDDGPRAKSKPAKSDRGNQEPVDVDHTDKSQPHTRSTVAAQSPATAAAAVSTSGRSKIAAAPVDKDEQPTDRPTDSVSENQSAPSRERLTPAGRPTAATAVPFAAIQSPTTPPESVSAQPSSKPQEVEPVAKDAVLSPLARLDRAVHRGGTHRAGDADQKPHVDPARFVSRVARAIHTAQERGTPLLLRLSPPELGAMRLELTVHQGALMATIETENATAKQLLLDHLPALRERLAEQNVRLERFDVDIRRDGQSSTGGQDNLGPHDRHHEHQPLHRSHTSRHTTSQSTTEEPTPIRRTITNTTINLVI